MVGDDVVAAGDQALVDAGQEGVGLGGPQDALQGGAADLGHALRAALQQQGQQGALHLGGVQLLRAGGTENTARQGHSYRLLVREGL